MGLGKTIQVLSLLLVLKHEAGEKRKPCLLVAPASLLANWTAEIARFAPSLQVVVAHPSAASSENPTTEGAANLADVDLVITSYGFLARLPWLGATAWRLVVLDEAQAVENPAAKQTRTVKQLRAETRFALTGTPIENRLGDLWSIFDFINPGLLGSMKGVFVIRQAPRRPAAEPVWPAPRSGAPLYLATHEDRQEDHCGLARQDRGEDILPLEPQAGGAVPAGRGRPRRPARRRRWNETQGHRPRVPHADEAGLSTIPRNGSATAPGPSRTAASSRDCATSPRWSAPARRRRWSHPVRRR